MKSNARWIGGGFLLTFFSSFGQTFFISASVAEWQAAFDLSHGGFGRIYMIATLASALTLPFLGKIVDVAPERNVIILTTLVLAAATVAAAFAPNIIILILAIYLLRLFGQGMMTHIALTATGRWFNAQRGRAVSLVVLGHQGGEFALPIVFAGVTAAYGISGNWLVAGAMILLIALPLGAWAYSVPRTPQSPTGTAGANGEETPTDDEGADDWTREQVLRDPYFWLLLTGVLAPAFIGTTLFFHQDYLTDLHDWPPHLFSLGLSVMALTTVTFALINGAAIDRYGAVSILPVLLLPLTASTFVAGAFSGEAMMFGFMILLGMSYGLSSTLFGALWPEIYGAKHLGAIRSVIVSAMVLATAIGPGLTGTLIDRGVALPTQLLFLSVYCLVVSGAMTIVSGRLKARLKTGRTSS